MSEKLNPTTSPWGWKAVVITVVLCSIFVGVIYLAVSNEPDYMPSQKRNVAQQNMEQQSTEMPEMTAEEHAAMKESAATMSNHSH